MRSDFSPSVNIIRDQERDLRYIPTHNAERVIEQLNSNVSKGIRSFYLVGSFGTGKSSFLLAFEKQISHGKKIFTTPVTFNGKTRFTPLNIVGDFRSLEDSIREELQISSHKDVMNELGRYYDKVHSSHKGLLIAIDEFGKFLEYASQHGPEKELYLIQKIAEFANDNRRNTLFITTLHQGFDVYRASLDEKTRNEWDKVKGRLKELTFNEPVEQLLHLAAQVLNGKPTRIARNDFQRLFEAILASQVYPLNNNLDDELAQHLFPFDLISASVLAKSLQRYGQNERSLFTFLETNDLNRMVTNASGYYSLPSVYDYLLNNFFSLLSTKYNPDYMKWSVIRNSIDRVDVLFDEHVNQKRELVKTVGLLNIFAPAGARINNRFLEVYATLALGIDNPSEQLKSLETKKLIRYQSYSDSYVLFEGTDLDIDLALNEAENYVTRELDIVARLNEHFDFPYLTAKASYTIKGTPRFFEFRISARPESYPPEGEVDGAINLVFPDGISVEQVKSISQENKEAFLYVVYLEPKVVERTLFEIDKIDHVLKNVADDYVAQRELRTLRAAAISELDRLVVDSLFEHASKTIWIYKGRTQKVASRSDLNKLLSVIIDEVYGSAPTFRNELINREKLPGAITVSRKSLFKNLVENWNKPELGFDPNKFPPERTIYLSLLKETGIHREVQGQYILAKPTQRSFGELWKTCEQFFDSCKGSRRSIVDLKKILSGRPFKLKGGFLDFWIPLYLYIKRDDYALFDSNAYIPNLSADLFDLIIKDPENYFIKTFDVRGVKLELFNRYRALINKSKEEKITSQTFIDTIRPFLTFYRALPEYSKRTQRLSGTAISIRTAIGNSTDPEKIFFEDLPAAAGFSTVDLYQSDERIAQFISSLRDSIREIRTSFEQLVDRIENRLLAVAGLPDYEFPKYKEVLVERYSSVKRYLLLPHQRAFYSRLVSGLDDRKAWLGALVQALIGKNLEQLTDDDEPAVHDKLNEILKQFDNLCEFANLRIDEAAEDAVRLEITTLNEMPMKSIIRLPKQDKEVVSELEEELRNRLVRDKTINLTALLRLLQEQINDRKG